MKRCSGLSATSSYSALLARGWCGIISDMNRQDRNGHNQRSATPLNSGVSRSVLGSLAALLALLPPETMSAPEATQPLTTNGIAVIELFHSDGCSSCPPADELVGKLALKARKQGTPIYVLSHHVDYWNRLGWKDPYSSKAATRRQRACVRALKLKAAWTPCAIINGAKLLPFRRVNATIQQALKKPALAQIAVSDLAVKDNTLTISATVTGALGDSAVYLAVVERGLVVSVSAGENKGKTLHHSATVRASVLVALPEHGPASLKAQIPADLKPSNATAIVLVQDKKTMRVLAASSTDLPPSAR